ncbi:hypothetical protein M430DRAFT_48475 [Amorphotheca resinae ATCC 22711]|uniref:Uncharacterized protein n=1 Tax=Amorphotheca resinae ATCC 22711 TaxID=857342 RepID=A0A2T3B7K9_AMORE|nr:hypothetical protein M430DRAFT_48475 [Amorphotheca resinae ATCC 22711]PSS22845.1 hypothetical protein M430DRAFT_48475 [Amorphotheca resinae ATCC 22711]
MYFQPFFASTYRYAQFARTVSHKEHYAEMVRVLDLSYFGAGAGEHWGLEPQAGWREFKCRYHNTSYVGGRKYARAQVSSHPAPSPLLKGFRRMRDIPVGGICHVLGACKRIRKINISRLQLASDFLLRPPEYPNSQPHSQIFVSDIPPSWTWQYSEAIPLYADEIISYILKLPYLESVTARNCLWLTTSRVGRLMREAGESLRSVDFRESGMQKDVRWAIRGGREEVLRIVEEVVRNTGDLTMMI